MQNSPLSSSTKQASLLRAWPFFFFSPSTKLLGEMCPSETFCRNIAVDIILGRDEIQNHTSTDRISMFTFNKKSREDKIVCEYVSARELK